MTPPSDAAAKKPVDQPVPEGPALPPKVEAEVKGEAKLEVGDKKTTEKKADEEVQKSGFNIRSIDGYSLQLGIGGAGRDTSDLDPMHGGVDVYAAFGLVGNWGKHRLSPKLYFNYAAMNLDLGEGVESKGKEYAIGAEFDYAYHFNKWVGLGGYIGLGAGIINATANQDELGLDDGMSGLVFNDNAILYPVDNAVSFNVRFGVRVPLFDGIVSPWFGANFVPGFNPEIEQADGGAEPFPATSKGFDGGITVDFMRIASKIWGKKEPKASSGSVTLGHKSPPAATDDAEEPKPATTTKPEAAPAKAPEKPTVESIKTKFAAAQGLTKDAAATAISATKKIYGNIKAEDDGDVTKLAADAVLQAKRARAGRINAEEAVTEMEALVESLDGDDKKAAEKELKAMKKEFSTDRDRKYNTLHENDVAAYKAAMEAVTAYHKYQVKHAGLDDVELKLDAPSGTSTRKAPTAAQKAAAAKRREEARKKREKAAADKKAKDAKDKKGDGDKKSTDLLDD